MKYETRVLLEPRLHRYFALKEGEEKEKIRDFLDRLYPSLDDEGKTAFSALSNDLKMLKGEEPRVGSLLSEEQSILQARRHLLKEENLDAILALRGVISSPLLADVAYLRSIAWGRLEFRRTATAFENHANRLGGPHHARCMALCITYPQGRCDRPAFYEAGSNSACWTHFKAHTNPVRSMPVEWQTTRGVR